MRVLIANRYGHVTGEIDLMRHFYAAESPKQNPVPQEVLSKRQLRTLQKLHPLTHERFIRECLKENQKEANKAMEPIPVAVTSCAGAHLAPSTSMAHL